MISPREILLGFPLPVLVCVLLCALAPRLREGFGQRLIQALALALPYLLGCYAHTGYAPIFESVSSATDLVPFLVLPVALLCALHWPEEGIGKIQPLLYSLGLLGMFFSRLSQPPSWLERSAVLLVLVCAWSASRSAARTQPAWRPLLALGTFAGAVACACICGRVASLALVAGSLGVCIGTSFLLSLRWPAWSFARPGHDVAVFALCGTLVCAVYLGYLTPLAALVLLASLALSRLPRFAHAFGTQLVLTGIGLWLAWPADGLAS